MRYMKLIICMLFIVCFCSCKKLIEVEPPVTSVTGASVYNSDATAIAVLTGLYTQITTGITGSTGISFLTALSSDELILNNSVTNVSQISYYKNDLSVIKGGYELWIKLYPYIFTCNSAIEGLNASNVLTPEIKMQLLGEAKFMRAFFYFYLVNIYGDLPILLTTDYTKNATLSRSSKSQVYEQIISDLTDAVNLLSDKYLKGDLINAYSSGAEERVRPTKWAAKALLARTYLYIGDWANAENQASAVINNVSKFSLAPLNDVFLKNSSEAIWQLQPVTLGRNTEDGRLFILPSTGPNNSSNPVYLSNKFLNSFDTSDQRKSKWIKSVTANNGSTYFYAFKYKANTIPATTTASEYTMVLRFAEQYLIRSEARTHKGDLIGAANDLNVIRSRAGLPSITGLSMSELLTAILQERKVELFTEWGHRWLDLKRTAAIDSVMSLVTPLKGGTWNTNQQLYPIPTGDIEKDPSLLQNPDY